MNFKSEINQLRRKFTRSMTLVFVGRSSITLKPGEEKADIKRVLINRPNHRLGNILMLTPLVQEIIAVFPDVKIDLFVRGNLAPIIFENYEQVDKTIKLPRKPFKELIKYLKVWIDLRKNKYDLVIDAVKGSSSGRISTSMARSRFRYFGDDFEDLAQKLPDYQHMAKCPVYNFRQFLTLVNHKSNSGEIPPLNLKLSDAEKENGKIVLNEVTKGDERETLAFFTYATGPKIYSQEWWDEFYRKFYPKYKDKFNLIEILPVENTSQLNHKLPAYYSKDIREIAAVMSNCKLIVAADSGMMHLSCASLTPTIGLFSVTSISMYEPYGNSNSFIDTRQQTHDDIIERMEQIIHQNG